MKVNAVAHPIDPWPPLEFDVLYLDNVEHIARFMQRHGITYADVEDATAQVFVAVLRSWPTFDPTREAGPDRRRWLYGIARNVLNELQRKQFRVVDDTIAQPLLVELREELDRRSRLWRALAKLKPEQRDVFILRHLEGFETHEVAKIVGIPPNTVKSRLYAAKKQLVKLLGRAS